MSNFCSDISTMQQETEMLIKKTENMIWWETKIKSLSLQLKCKYTIVIINILYQVSLMHVEFMSIWLFLCCNFWRLWYITTLIFIFLDHEDVAYRWAEWSPKLSNILHCSHLTFLKITHNNFYDKILVYKCYLIII